MSPKPVSFHAASNQGSENRRHLLADSSKKGKGKGSGKGKGKEDGKRKGKKNGKEEKGDGEGKPGNNQGAQGTDQGGLGLGFGGINQAQQGELDRTRTVALYDSLRHCPSQVRKLHCEVPMHRSVAVVFAADLTP
jgi:hypothetical protein